MKKLNPSAEQIDAILPQTQCGLCTYDGCKPYAKALANGEADINLCPPGGVKGLYALADLLGRDAAPFIDEMQHKEKPMLRAFIREAECIGCTKCIQACPIDAILGSGKLMHTVITDECSGCELCVAPCPVDCIDMLPTDQPLKSAQYRERYEARQVRLQHTVDVTAPVIDEKKAYLAAVLARVKKK